MFKLVNHIEANRGRMEGKHLNFPTPNHPKGPYKHHIVVRVDTGADVNCMNEKTFNELFPEVQLSVWPHEIQNFGNLVADISILGQFCTYLEFRGEKYLNTFIVTNANDCSNLLSYGATFRMGVLLPNYPEENVMKGDNVPNFSKGNGGRTGNSTAHGTLHGTQHGISDQKPLVSIYNKHMIDISPRVQKLSQIFPIPAIQSCVQEKSRHSSCRCT